MTALILFFALALLVSFFCSLAEAALLSVPHSYIETLVKGQHRSGRVLKELKERLDRSLAAILTLNTVANTVGAAGVGAQALKLANDAWPDSSNNKWVALASALLTVSILIFSEIIPKTVGAVYCRQLAPATAHCIKVLIGITYPIVLLSESLGKVLARGSSQQKVSREEMAASAQIGADEGSLAGQEMRIIRNLLHLGRVRAKNVLTPRSVVLAFPQKQTVQQVVRNHSPLRFSRLPIYGKDLDDITGLVLRHDVLQAYSQGKVTTTLGELAKPIHAVPETKSVASILDEFIHKREQLFLVVDEYGGTAGIITLEDAIETLLGVEIVDEFDSVEDMRKLASQIFRRGRQLDNTDDSSK